MLPQFQGRRGELPDEVREPPGAPEASVQRAAQCLPAGHLRILHRSRMHHSRYHNYN